MNIFGTRKAHANEEKTPDDSIDWPNRIEEMAKAAGEEASLKFGALLEESVEEHERQKNGFSFSCTRWGEFLTVNIGRNGNGVIHGLQMPKKESVTINLGMCDSIELEEGRPPDMSGKLRFSLSCIGLDGVGSILSPELGRGEPPKGYEYEVKPELPYIPEYRKLVIKSKGDSNNHWSSRGYHTPPIRYTHAPAPRPSKDDLILFNGAAIEIPAPFSMGAEVLNSILTAIKNGYEPATLPGTNTKEAAA